MSMMYLFFKLKYQSIWDVGHFQIHRRIEMNSIFEMTFCTIYVS